MKQDGLLKVALFGGIAYLLLGEELGFKSKKWVKRAIPPHPGDPRKSKKITKTEANRGWAVKKKLEEVLNKTYYLDASDRCDTYRQLATLSDREIIYVLNTFAESQKKSVLQAIKETNVNGCNELYGTDWEEILIKRINTLLTNQYYSNGNLIPYDKWIQDTGTGYKNAEYYAKKLIEDEKNEWNPLYKRETCNVAEILITKTDLQLVEIRVMFNAETGKVLESELKSRTQPCPQYTNFRSFIVSRIEHLADEQLNFVFQ